MHDFNILDTVSMACSVLPYQCNIHVVGLQQLKQWAMVLNTSVITHDSDQYIPGLQVGLQKVVN